MPPSWPRSSTTVSYTHLDVYKRQVTDSLVQRAALPDEARAAAERVRLAEAFRTGGAAYALSLIHI